MSNEIAVAPLAPDVLRSSMARYASLRSLRVDCEWISNNGDDRGGSRESRSLVFDLPNRYRVETDRGNGKMISACDGSRVVEFSRPPHLDPRAYAAPVSIADAATMLMTHPMFCGSLIYRMFAGPDRFAELVKEEAAPVEFGAREQIDGAECVTVKFWAAGSRYGTTEFAIGETDGLIRRIHYHSEPTLERMRSTEFQEMFARMLISPEFAKLDLATRSRLTGVSAPMRAITAPFSSETTERYFNFVVDEAIPADAFMVHVPEGAPIDEGGGCRIR